MAQLTWVSYEHLCTETVSSRLITGDIAAQQDFEYISIYAALHLSGSPSQYRLPWNTHSTVPTTVPPHTVRYSLRYRHRHRHRPRRICRTHPPACPYRDQTSPFSPVCPESIGACCKSNLCTQAPTSDASYSRQTCPLCPSPRIAASSNPSLMSLSLSLSRSIRLRTHLPHQSMSKSRCPRVPLVIYPPLTHIKQVDAFILRTRL